MHDEYTSRDAVRIGSERSFAIVFAAVFAIIGGWPLLDGASPRWWALAAGVAFLGLGFLAPKALRPLNRVWFRFGRLLHRIVSPLVLGILFFSTLTPTAWAMRALGKDPLRLARKGPGESYWVPRDGEGQGPGSFKNQF